MINLVYNVLQYQHIWLEDIEKTQKMDIPFKEKVYRIAHTIPKGKVATYGQLARLAGNKKAARAVGLFMKNNKDRSVVPCHRVVAANGALTGYSFGRGIATKRKILEKEGVAFKGQKVDLLKSQWKKIV